MQKAERDIIVISRQKLQHQGKVVYVALLLIGAVFMSQPFLSQEFSWRGMAKVIAAIIVPMVLWFLPKWNTFFHEGLHITYAIFHGVSVKQISTIPGSHREHITPLFFSNVPKPLWLQLTFYPFLASLTLFVIAVVFQSPPFVFLFTLMMAGCGNDLLFIWKVWRTPGRFVTTTDTKIIVSPMPLPEEN